LRLARTAAVKRFFVLSSKKNALLRLKPGPRWLGRDCQSSRTEVPHSASLHAGYELDDLADRMERRPNKARA